MTRDELDAMHACELFSAWLTTYDVKHVRVENRRRRHVGAPHFLLPTLHAAVLVKRADGAHRIYPHQEQWLEELDAAGWRTTVAFGYQDACHFVVGLLARGRLGEANV